MKDFLKKFDLNLARFESGFIFFFLMFLVIAGVLQILLRRLTDYAIPDLEISMRWIVVWLTFFGASLATRKRKHISIDVLGRLLTGNKKRILDIFINLFSLFIVLLLLITSWNFVKDEMAFGGTLMNNISSWVIEIVFPLGFSLIALRLLINVLTDFLLLISKSEEN